VNLYSSSRDGTIWPKTVLIFPTLMLLGFWMLADAKALASARRRFTPGLWACIGVGSVLGLMVIHTLTGGWF